MRHILEYQDGVSFFGTSTNWEEKVEMGEGRSFGLEMMVQKTLGKTTGWLAIINSVNVSTSELRGYSIPGDASQYLNGRPLSSVPKAI